MNQAIAAIAPSIPHPAFEAATPLVLIDGVPRPDLHVREFVAELPVDHRSATVSSVKADPDTFAFVRGATVTIADPHQLSDGEVRWRVLVSGSMHAVDQDLSAGTDRQQWIVVDDLASSLGESFDTLGALPDAGLTLDNLLDRLRIQLQCAFVPACDPALLESPVPLPADPATTLSDVLVPALESIGCRLDQSVELEMGRIRRTLVLLPRRAGRRIALPWPDSEGLGGAVNKVDASAQQDPPCAWVATGDRPVVEDTFMLVKGWDPSLTGQPDADYGRLTSSDFSRFGSVYRAWVLNEDGAFSGPPFDQGEAYDAGALFGDPATITTPLRLGYCLARDASGRAIRPVIESSTDSGMTWSVYPGQAEVMRDRAGVLLVDDVLPSAILAAAKADTLRLRVIASLTGPDPIREQRWDGNPFAGPGPTRLIPFGNRFGWRRIAPTSIHADEITAGVLTADTTDDRAAMRTALQLRIADSPGQQVKATVDLAGAWTAISVGDLVSEVLEPGRGIDGTPTVFGGRDARVRRIDIDFGVSKNAPRTRLYLD